MAGRDITPSSCQLKCDSPTPPKKGWGLSETAAKQSHFLLRCFTNGPWRATQCREGAIERHNGCMISAGKGPARECAARTNLPRPPARDAFLKEILCNFTAVLDFFFMFKKISMLSAGMGIKRRCFKLKVSRRAIITSDITSHVMGFILVMPTMGLPIVCLHVHKREHFAFTSHLIPQWQVEQTRPRVIFSLSKKLISLNKPSSPIRRHLIPKCPRSGAFHGEVLPVFCQALREIWEGRRGAAKCVTCYISP